MLNMSKKPNRFEGLDLEEVTPTPKEVRASRRFDLVEGSNVTFPDPVNGLVYRSAFRLSLHNASVLISVPGSGASLEGLVATAYNGKRVIMALKTPDSDRDDPESWEALGTVGEDGRPSPWKEHPLLSILDDPEKYSLRGLEVLFKLRCTVCNKELITARDVVHGHHKTCKS